jgi:TDG/mug DNA glycosylase family protein
MGSPIETLGDLIPASPRIVCVGINPAPISVAAGHYYQGRLGQRFFDRLRQVGLLPDDTTGWEDDAAYQEGVGFTDIVKRSTGSSTEVTPAELRHGAEILTRKLVAAGAPLVVFAFKQAAVSLFGTFNGNGFVPDLRLGAGRVFVMPGPFERRDTADQTLDSLKLWLRQSG